MTLRLRFHHQGRPGPEGHLADGASKVVSGGWPGRPGRAGAAEIFLVLAHFFGRANAKRIGRIRCEFDSFRTRTTPEHLSQDLAVAGVVMAWNVALFRNP